MATKKIWIPDVRGNDALGIHFVIFTSPKLMITCSFRVGGEVGAKFQPYNEYLELHVYHFRGIVLFNITGLLYILDGWRGDKRITGH